MRSEIKRLISVVAVTLIGGLTVSAAEIPYSVEYDYSNRSFKISGESLTDGEMVSVQILKPDMTIAGDGDAAVLYRGQYTVKDKGYSFAVEYADGTDGVCGGVLASNKEDEATSFEVRIVSKGVLEGVYSALNTAAEEDDFDTFKKTVNENIGFLTGNKVTSGELGTELNDYFAYVKKNKLENDESVKNTKILNTFLTIDKLNKSKLDNINGEIDSIYLDETLAGEYKALATKDGIQKYFTEKMSGKDIEDLDDFELAFKEALVLTTARYGSAYGELQSMVKKYGSSVGIKGTPSSSAAVYKRLLGTDHKNASGFKSAYDKAVKAQESGGSGGGSGSGGSGGGSGSAGKGIASSNVSGIVGVNGSNIGSAGTVSCVFNDIEGVTWASEAILALADKGIVNGKGDGKFKPDDNVTREEFVKILTEALGIANANYSGNVFSDVKDSDWFCKYVNIANEKQIVKGIGGGEFGVGRNITRQDMVVMLYNALKFKNAELPVAEPTFEDKAQIADYARGAVGALCEMGAVNGVSETRFDPTGVATRAQAAKVVYAVLKHLR